MEQTTYEGEVIQGGAIQHAQKEGNFLEVLETIDVDRAITLFEKRVDVLEKFKKISFKVTNERDWIDQDGDPYLNSSGADKVSTTLGISYDIIGYPTKEISEDDQGKFYIYSAVVKVKHPFLGEKMMNGAASQRDLLFGYTKAGGWKKASEINEINIQKKAVTNAVGRAIRALLGLNNLTWEDLPENLRGNTRAKVSYKKNNNSNGSGSTTSAPTSGNPKRDLQEALHALCDGDESAMADKLQELSSFKKEDGTTTFKRSVDELSDSWAARILKNHPELVVPR